MFEPRVNVLEDKFEVGAFALPGWGRGPGARGALSQKRLAVARGTTAPCGRVSLGGAGKPAPLKYST